MTWEDAASVTAAAGPAAVWSLLLDGRRWSEWNPGVQWMVIEGPLEPGNLLTMKPKGAPQTAFRIEQVVPERRLGLLLTFGPMAALRLGWTLEAVAAGTRIDQTIAIDGFAAGLLLKKTAGKIAATMPQNLARLAACAERLRI
ncbi:MAG: hypothetical protein NVS2B17_30750 [Candidatus Velthaea sp.]